MASRKDGSSGSNRKKDRNTRVSDVRRAAKRVSRDDLYDPDTRFLYDRFNTEAVYAWFQRAHKAGYTRVGEDGVYRRGPHEWKVPIGVRLCLRKPLLWTHMVKLHPWFVTWRSPKTGKRLRKYFSSPWQAIDFITTQAQYVDPRASLVNRNGFDIPPKLRGKIPAPWKWCPRCMTARRFRAVKPDETFQAMRKEWIEEKGRYEYRDRQLRLLGCTVCGCTNRDSTMRRSNQPWEVRRFKRGVRRAKRR